MSCILLVDNGSMRPDVTLRLRELASVLSDRIGKTVHPVSLQHANQINPDLLDGRPAQVLTEFLVQQLEAGKREFIVLPLFFGESRALTVFMPEQVDALKKIYGEFSLQLTELLYPLPAGEPLLVEILRDYVVQIMQSNHVTTRNVVLVDHGSPVIEVNRVRQSLAENLQSSLGDSVVIEQAAMERRDGKDYDFNGELLEDWLIAKAEEGGVSAIVTLLFLFPGRHAGKDGDIENICASVMTKYPSFKVYITPLISEHENLSLILSSRLRTALS